MRAQIRQRKTLSGVLSASALERVGAFWYITGDDAREVYRLDDAFAIVGRTPLENSATSNAARITKENKFDMEAMTTVAWNGRTELVLFGSGSKSPARDVCFRIDVTDPASPQNVRACALTALYDTLRANPAIVGAHQLNLEAAAATRDTLWLFQRGNISGIHAVMEFETRALLQYLDAPAPAPPAARLATFTLPHIKNRRAGFSAATMLNDSQILFAASVEDTDNEIDDGATLGSFVGLMEFQNDWRVQWIVPVEQAAEIAPVKIEGLACTNFARGKLDLFAVTDADGEPSQVLAIEIQ